jgi:hypothetical protein
MLFNLAGDLTWRQSFDSLAPRDVEIETVELKGGERVEPQVESDLPFFSVDLLSTSEQLSNGAPDTIHRHYKYRVGFKSKPDTAGFTGVLRCTDPWDPNHVMNIHVYGENVADPRAVPSRIVLEAKDKAQVRFAVFQRRSPGKASLVADSNLGPALRVEPVKDVDPAGAQSFTVTLHPDGLAGGVDRGSIRVYAASDPSYQVVIPVLIRKGPSE